MRKYFKQIGFVWSKIWPINLWYNCQDEPQNVPLCFWAKLHHKFKLQFWALKILELIWLYSWTRKSKHDPLPVCVKAFLRSSQVTYLPSARLMERNKGYSSGAGLPCWSSYRKTGARPTSTPNCWIPCWLYMDSRKDWRPALGLMVNRIEKSSGKMPPGGGTRRRMACVGYLVEKPVFYSTTLLQINLIIHMGTIQHNHSILINFNDIQHLRGMSGQ